MLNRRAFCLLRVLVALLICSCEAKSPGAPLLVFSEGCSGSTSLVRTIGKFLRIEGIHTYNKPQKGTNSKGKFDWEVCHKDKNPFYREHEGMATAMKKLARDAEHNETTLLIKCEVLGNNHLLDSSRKSDVLKALKGLGTTPILFWRSNVLDHYICTVRDCFHSSNKEYPVSMNGKETDLCFKRRRSNTTVKAMLDPSRMVRKLKEMRGYVGYATKLLKGNGIEVPPPFTYETLFGFQSNCSMLGTSAVEWQRLLKIFGVDISSSKIEDVLRPAANSRPLTSHFKVIYNLKEVWREFFKKSNAHLLHYLRSTRDYPEPNKTLRC